MNNSTIVFLINDDVRAVMAVYDDTQKPEIFKTFDTTIEPDDLVVVESTTRHGMTVVKVTEVDVDLDLDTGANIKWIVQRIDNDAHSAVLAQEAEAITAVQSAEKRRKRDALRKAVFADQEDKISSLRLANHADDGVTE